VNSEVRIGAKRLYDYLAVKHWNGRALVGPDPGIRLNYRFGRFAKSYLSLLPWKDDLYYLQAQGYWILGNWCLGELTGDPEHEEIAVRCSKYMIEQQGDDGSWLYPNREWRGRVANAEGTWGSLGLLASYRKTGDEVFLLAARAWHDYLVKEIGFQVEGDAWAVNYFAHRRGARVPNNSAFVLRFLAELADVTGDESHMKPCPGLLEFMRTVQKATGEFPYSVAGEVKSKVMPHFQCYQYNAFQCLDLLRYYELTREAVVLPLIVKALAFLQEGLTADGHARYQCGNRYRAVTYHTAALGAAFAKAGRLGVAGYDYQMLAERSYASLLAQQRPDGGFPIHEGTIESFAMAVPILDTWP